MTRQRLPAASNPAARESEARKPCPSVLAPMSSSSRLTTQLTRRSRGDHVGAAIDQCRHLGLVRHGDRKAGQPECPHAAERGWRLLPARTSKATETQLMPSAAKAALWRRARGSAGPGEPMTPTTGGACRDQAAGTAQPNPARLGQLLVGQLLGEGVGERLGPVLSHQLEVEPGARGGWTAAARAVGTGCRSAWAAGPC